MTGAIGLLIALASIVIYGLGTVILMWWMFDGKIEVLPGFVGIFGTIAMLAVTIFGGGGWLSGILIILYLSLLLTFPYAEQKLAEVEVRGYNVELIDRSYQELHRRPDNIPAAFQLARSLYNYGMRGHAINLSEQTLNRLSTDQDPTSNRSIRDIYRNEEYELKKWKEASQSPDYYKPLKCPKCGMMNPPGHLACQRCQGPYLLEIARSADPRGKVMGKLVISWGMIAGIIPFSAWAGFALRGFLSVIAVAAGFALTGLVLYWTFKLAPGETGEVRTSA